MDDDSCSVLLSWKEVQGNGRDVGTQKVMNK